MVGRMQGWKNLKAVIMDDERLAISYLEKILSDLEGIEVIGKYQDPRLALTEAPQLNPDVIFLDVEMPGISGIEAAEKLQELIPGIDIVFVTAYDEYAVKAFELNALDYVLKPIERDRLVKTVRRLSERRVRQATALPVSTHVTTIHCFQLLQVEITPDRPESIRWRTAKAQELFAYLLHHRSKPVRKDILIDLFWPDTDWKKGTAQLYTAIYQIRKKLEELGVNIHISNFDEGYLLDCSGVRLDVDEWENGLSTVAPLASETLAEHMDLLNMYRGDYLADYDYLWAESERQRLRMRWMHHARQVVDFFKATKRYAEAVDLYHRLLGVDPHAEEWYMKLMQLYDEYGDRESVVKYYEQLKKMLHDEFDVEPSPSVQLWYRNWIDDKSRKQRG